MDLQRLEAELRRSNPVRNEDVQNWAEEPAGQRVWKQVLAARRDRTEAREAVRQRGRRPYALGLLAVFAAVVVVVLLTQPAFLSRDPKQVAQPDRDRPVTKLEAVLEIGKVMSEARKNLGPTVGRISPIWPALETFGLESAMTALNRDSYVSRGQLALLVWEAVPLKERRSVPAGAVLPMDGTRESEQNALSALRFCGLRIGSGDASVDSFATLEDVLHSASFLRHTLRINAGS